MIIKQFFSKIYQLLFYLTGVILPKNDKLVIFESFFGRQYSDNPRAIYEYMLEHLPGYQLLWSVDRQSSKQFQQLNLPHVRRFSIKWLFVMNRAKYWVTNVRLPNWIPKPSHTIFVQTWHGTPLKKLGVDIKEVVMPGITTERYHQNFINEAKKWDYLVSPNPYSSKIFKSAFQFEGEIIESGYPRNDLLTTNNREDYIEELKVKMGIPKDKKVILYAPTWRDNNYYRVGQYKFNLNIDFKKLQKRIGDEYVVILRMHYLIAENFDLTEYEDFVIDHSHCEDIRDLYLISDLLITDYSSVFFDYGILNRPIIFYVDDLEEYRSNIRGFYFDFEKEAPGPLVKTSEELLEAITNSEMETKQHNRFEQFQHKYCSLEDGNASQRVVNKIFLS